MFVSELTAEAFQANTEYSLAIPPGTRRIVLNSPSAFPIRFSLVTGDVLANRGFVLRDTKVIGGTIGPLFFASKHPHALLEADCFVDPTSVLVSTASAYSVAYSSAFADANVTMVGQMFLTDRFGGNLLSSQGAYLRSGR